MKKNLLITTALIAFAVMFITIAPAKATEFGIMGGLNMANMTGDFEDNKAMMTFGGGVFGRVSPSPQFTIQSELLYMQKGTKWEGAEGEDDEEMTLTYVEVPVLLMYNFPMPGPISPCVFAGPYFATLLSAKDKFEGEELDVKELFKDTDFGAVFGVGVDIKTGASGKFFFNGRYSLGLSNVNDFLPEEFSVKHGVMSVFAGYAISLGP